MVKDEPHRALEHLEEFHSRLLHPEDDDLRFPVERIIKAFKTCLFQSLVEIQDLTEDVLLDARVPRSQKILEATSLAELWENKPPMPTRKQLLQQTKPVPAARTPSTSPQNDRPGFKSQDSGLFTSNGTSSHHSIHNVEVSTSVSYDDYGRAWEYEDIALDQGNTGLGLSFAGGKDWSADSDPSIYITSIIKGGAAYADGRLRIGDVITQANETDCTSVSHAAAKEALMSAGKIVRLKVKRRRKELDNEEFSASRMRSASATHLDNSEFNTSRIQQQSINSLSTPSIPKPPPPPKHAAILPEITQRQQYGTTVDLYKGAGGLGFRISGGIGNEQIPHDSGIFITNVIEDGCAHRDGRLNVGDKILEVDGYNLENTTHNYALEVLRSTGSNVSLRVLSNPYPELTRALQQSTIPDTPTTPQRANSSAHLGQFGGSTSGLNQNASAQSPGEIDSQHEIVPLYPRNVTLIRGPRGLGFNIIGGENGEPIYISNVHQGGVADQTGNVKRGDVLLSVNGVNLENATHQQAADALKNAVNPITLTLQHRPQACELLEQKLSEIQDAPLYVRCLFEFDPNREGGVPPRTMGFQYGDILHITNSADNDWWTARKVADNGEEGPEGVVPSRRRVEKRERGRRRNVNFDQDPQQAFTRNPMDGRRGSRSQLSFSRRFPFVKSTERLDVAEPQAPVNDDPVYTYQEVERKAVAYARPVIICGAMKERINDELCKRYPNQFACCIPHTSRPPREGEVHGQEYFFVDKETMRRDVDNNLFIEAGTFQDNLYGTSIQAVKAVMNTDRHCVLDVGLNAIVRMRVNTEIQPISLFIKPSSHHQVMDWDRMLSPEDAYEITKRCQKIDQLSADLFTHVITQATSFEELLSIVFSIIRSESQPTAWIAA